jgi:hypothetical protein
MSKYEEFQEWLNECPVKITRYEDFTDFFEVTFDVVDDEVEELVDNVTSNPTPLINNQGG